MPSWLPRLGQQASTAQLGPASLDNELAWLLNDVSLLHLCEKKRAPLSFFSLIFCRMSWYWIVSCLFVFCNDALFLSCAGFFHMYIKADVRIPFDVCFVTAN